MPNVMKIPDAEAAVDMEKARDDPNMEFGESQIKTEVILESTKDKEKVHFASLMDISHLKKCGVKKHNFKLYLQPYNKSYVRHKQKHQHTQEGTTHIHALCKLTMECRRNLVRCGSWPSLELSAEPKQTLSPRQAQAVIARKPQDLAPALPPTLAHPKNVVDNLF